MMKFFEVGRIDERTELAIIGHELCVIIDGKLDHYFARTNESKTNNLDNLVELN